MHHATTTAACTLLLLLCAAGQAFAHFGMVTSSRNIVTQQEKSVELALSFSHPFEGIGMDMAKPEKFYVVRAGERTDILPALTEDRIMNHRGWRTAYRVRRPGVYHFVVEPAPYWEPLEDAFIVHYARTVVAAFGADEGWDEPLGLPVEIAPLTRPFGNYAGNSFRGRVLINGLPAPHVDVEVEFYNRDGSRQAPSEYHLTQVVKADAEGIFSFSCPWAGWWGFAALSEADYTLKNPEGEPKNVELGAVLWIYMDEASP